MTKTQLEAMSLAALSAVYNTYAAKPIKKFTCSKAEAVARVRKVLPDQSSTAAAKTSVAKPKAAKAPSTKGAGPRTGVCALMTQLFARGLNAPEVFEQIQRQLPAAKTSYKAVLWFRSYLKRQEGGK